MNVSVSLTKAEYPPPGDFSPPERFPEYPFPDKGGGTNHVYAAVRQSLEVLGLDREHVGQPGWNPFSDIVKPGQTVVVKPNFVLGRNYRQGSPVECSITHGSVLRPLVDYVYIALQGNGSIIICDAPQHDADWEDILRHTGVGGILEFYRRNVKDPRFSLSLIDLRPERVEYRHHMVWKREKLAGDPLGYADVDLGKSSWMKFDDSSGFYGADYDRRKIIEAHSGGRNVYNVARTILSADTVIGVPKLKVHKKCGVTLNLKLLVGINGTKNLIPHYRIPTSRTEGDCFPATSLLDRLDRAAMDFLLTERRWAVGKYVFAFLWRKLLVRAGSRLFPVTAPTMTDGNWYGNDTVWRATLDLMKILLYADKNGTVRPSSQRKFFSVVDGVIGGEREGPLAPSPRPAGLIVAGQTGAAVDVVSARLMGFDPAKITMLQNAFAPQELPVSEESMKDIKLLTGESEIRAAYEAGRAFVLFEPHPGWKGHIELSPPGSGEEPIEESDALNAGEFHVPHQ